MRRFALAILIPAAATACSTKDSATIQLETGGETDTFTETPVPTSLVVQAMSAPDSGTTVANVPLPATSVDLGDQSESNQATLTVSGIAASGTVVYGASLYLDFGSLVGDTVPIFVQRVGETARLPGSLDARTSPLLSSVQSEYVFVAGANEQPLAATTQLYDFQQLAPLGSPPAMPVIPLSMAVVGTVAMLFDGTSNTGATYFDLSENATAQVPAPGGQYTFADVAGGKTVVAADGTTFIVGGTRTVGSPTKAVLEIDPNDTTNASYVSGNLTWLSLSAPRFGAAATWVAGHGVVVAGGSATAPGVEILTESGSATDGYLDGGALSYPPDPTIGAGATTTDDLDTLVLAGGLLPSGADPGVRSINLACPPSCTTTTWTSLGTPIGSSNAFDIDSTHILVVGNELASGKTHVFLVAGPPPAATATELLTKVPHTNASAVVSPVGSVVILGGNELMESVQLIVPPGE